MTNEKSPGRKAKEQDQRAARYGKLERKGRADPAEHASWGDKKRDAQHAANIYRSVDKAKNK